MPKGSAEHVKQYLLTVAAGKRLIAKGIVRHDAVAAAMKKGTLVIVAGSTNGYVAQEALGAIGQAEGFSRRGFRRGVTVAPGAMVPKAELAGDVVIVNGQWQKGKQIFDVIDSMQAGDVVLKGGNALDLARRRAAVYIGHPMGGTIGAAIPAVIGRRVQLIVPIGLEKRVADDVHDLAAELNSPACQGPRMMVMPGPVFTELDAIGLLTGASARLVAAGGIYGAQGAVWIAVKGTESQLLAADEVMASVVSEPPCEV